MKSIKRIAAEIFAAYRSAQIQKIVAQPEINQKKLLTGLIQVGANTTFGRAHAFNTIKDYKSYIQQVPTRDYEGFRSYIDEIFEGKQNVLWKGLPLYFAKTSGTTSGTKYIPISAEAMPNHVKGARDALLLYIHQTKKSAFVDGKMIFLSGSPNLETHRTGIKIGRLSGIAQHYVPSYLQRNRLPTYSTNCIEDWEEKITQIVKETASADLRLVSGIPPWVQMYFEKLKEYSGKTPYQNWQNLGLFVQGGVDFTPYKPIFEQSLGGKVDIVEVYPASEGFIAVQDSQKEEGLLLMLDYGIFYEFIPLQEYGKPDAPRLPLWEVELNQPYAIILTTNSGLWAYDIGDVVRFTKLKPYKIKVTGRVKHYISAFGEHVIEEEINAALTAAVQTTQAEVIEFTVAPMVSANASYHEWFIEFNTLPNQLELFCELLDNTLQQKNTYYKDLRTGGMLQPAQVRILPQGTCRAYMKSIGKLGGQNKFPRVTNQRVIADALITYQKHKP